MYNAAAIVSRYDPTDDHMLTITLTLRVPVHFRMHFKFVIPTHVLVLSEPPHQAPWFSLQDFLHVPRTNFNRTPLKHISSAQTELYLIWCPYVFYFVFYLTLFC